MAEYSNDKESHGQARTTPSETAGCGGFSACPSLKTFPAFLDGGLSDEEISAFERHLVDCALCRDKLMDIRLSSRSYEQEPQSLPSGLRHTLMERLLESRRRSVVELVYDAGRGVLRGIMSSGEHLRLQPVPVRGGAFQSAYKVSLGQVEVEVASDRRRDGSFDVWLRADAGEKGLYRCEWQLWDGNKLIEQQPSGNGEGWFNAVPSGRYQFVLSVSGQEIGILNLTLHEGEDNE